MALVIVSIDGQPQVAEVVRENPLTIWVRLRNGDVIQRHRRKHDVGYVRDTHT